MSDNFFENTIRAESHRGFVGMQMFCPYCNGILDCKKSVSIDMFIEDRTLVLSKIVCKGCFDRYCDMEAAAKKLGTSTLELFNGATNEFTIVRGS
jgi:hypothetical protein